MLDHSLQRWADLPRRRKRLRLAGFDYSDPHSIFFITLCARHDLTPFTNIPLAEEVTNALLYRSTRDDWRLYAYCLMPDHLHLALSPQPNKGDVPFLLQGFKSYTTRLSWQFGNSGALWHRGYYDHVARRDEDALAMCEYILLNPVRKGLVEEPDHWAFSGMPHQLGT